MCDKRLCTNSLLLIDLVHPILIHLIYLEPTTLNSALVVPISLGVKTREDDKHNLSIKVKWSVDQCCETSCKA